MPRLDRYVTAVSLRPLPPSAELRETVDAYIHRHSPAEILRHLADRLEAAEAGGADPDGVAALAPRPVHEANEFYGREEYAERAFRRTYRADGDHVRRIAALSLATGLCRTAIIRAALHRLPLGAA